jgi:hypothetical protein
MLSRCTPIFVHSFLTSKISGTPYSLLCSWHLLMEEKKLLAKLNSFALHHTVQYKLCQRQKRHRLIYSMQYTIIFTVFRRELQKFPLFWMSAGKWWFLTLSEYEILKLFSSLNFFASFVTSLIPMVLHTDIWSISLFPTVLKVAE